MNPRSRPDAPLALTAALAMLGIPSLAADALAQSVWNRLLEVHTDGSSSLPNNIGTSVDVNVDGLLVASHTIPIGSDPGSGGCADAAACGSGCGSGTVDGVGLGLLCVADGPCSPICDCSASARSSCGSTRRGGNRKRRPTSRTRAIDR
ncbi:MAG: hypothetical protein ACRDGR_02995 [bacterium]